MPACQRFEKCKIVRFENPIGNDAIRHRPAGGLEAAILENEFLTMEIRAFLVLSVTLAAAIESPNHPKVARDIARCKACKDTATEIRAALKKHDHKHKLKVSTLDLVKEMNALCQKHRHEDKQVSSPWTWFLLNWVPIDLMSPC